MGQFSVYCLEKNAGHCYNSVHNIPKFDPDPRKIPDDMMQNRKVMDGFGQAGSLGLFFIKKDGINCALLTQQKIETLDICFCSASDTECNRCLSKYT